MLDAVCSLFSPEILSFAKSIGMLEVKSGSMRLFDDPGLADFLTRTTLPTINQLRIEAPPTPSLANFAFFTCVKRMELRLNGLDEEKLQRFGEFCDAVRSDAELKVIQLRWPIPSDGPIRNSIRQTLTRLQRRCPRVKFVDFKGNVIE